MAKTGFLMLDVGASCFETFAAAGPTYHCKLNGKSLQLAFKSLKNVERVGLHLGYLNLMISASLSAPFKRSLNRPFKRKKK